METHRLYLDDPFLFRFRASVVSREEDDVGPWVVLDRTAFYPAAGGQPHDTGTLDGVRVVEVVEADGTIRHRLDGDLPGDRVVGEVDHIRRRELTEQHTTQHLLSRFLQERHGIRTLAHHIAEDDAYVDLDRWRPEIRDALEEELARATARALPLTVRWVDREEALTLNLRRLPDGLDRLRIVTIPGIDHNACGGTHTATTADLAPIHVLGMEKIGARHRLRYRAGSRARAEERRQRDLLEGMARMNTTRAEELPARLEKLTAEARVATRELASVRAELARERLLAARGSDPAPAVLVREIAVGEGDAYAAAVGDLPPSVLLLGWRDGERAGLLFLRTATPAVDLRPVLAAAISHVDGRGGGRPGRVEGGGSRAGGLPQALKTAEARAREALTDLSTK
jgi:alanyl-tRNA synthetase